MRPATKDEIALFALMGQALLNIQVLEECLSASLTLRLDVGFPRKVSKAEADDILKKRRSLTLGMAIKEVLRKEVYGANLQTALKTFLEERNWLVHKSIDDIYTPSRRAALYQRIMSIANEAHRLQRAIEDDLIDFSESNGMHMSSVKAAIRKWSISSDTRSPSP